MFNYEMKLELGVVALKKRNSNISSQETPKNTIALTPCLMI
jgi:hypothetical protein